MAGYFRKVIQISAYDSPNVITRQQVLPGVLTWDEFQHREATWDEVRKCVGLYGKFYEGKELLLFPPDWLDLCEANWRLVQSSHRMARAIGVDPGEGGANSSWSVIDDLGVIELISKKTPDTTDVPDITVELIDRWNVPCECVGIDAGGGGKQHADYLRKRGYPIRTVSFGVPPALRPKRGLRMIEEKVEMQEESYAYTSRRVEMYHDLSHKCDPSLNRAEGLPGFAIPSSATQVDAPCHIHGNQCLRHQLSLLPKMTDKEGRFKLPPKNRTSAETKERVLNEIIGHSPDEADSLVVALHMLVHRQKRARAGAF